MSPWVRPHPRHVSVTSTDKSSLVAKVGVSSATTGLMPGDIIPQPCWLTETLVFLELLVTLLQATG